MKSQPISRSAREDSRSGTPARRNASPPTSPPTGRAAALPARVTTSPQASPKALCRVTQNAQPVRPTGSPELSSRSTRASSAAASSVNSESQDSSVIFITPEAVYLGEAVEVDPVVEAAARALAVARALREGVAKAASGAELAERAAGSNGSADDSVGDGAGSVSSSRATCGAERTDAEAAVRNVPEGTLPMEEVGPAATHGGAVHRPGPGRGARRCPDLGPNGGARSIPPSVPRRFATVNEIEATCNEEDELADEVSEIEPLRDGGMERPEPGDVVVLSLSSGVPAEHRGRPAVVTRVAGSQCGVVVLDPARRFGIGECWPHLSDLGETESRAWRLGSRVVVGGLWGEKTRWLNGLTGAIASHPREGHPTFVRKSTPPYQPQLAVCVRLDETAVAGSRAVLLEPRFLVPHEQYLREVSQALLACRVQPGRGEGMAAGGVALVGDNAGGVRADEVWTA